jgi:hypothetical protein
VSTKTLGAFTGRQLTTIIVALIIAVAIPTAAYGVTVGHTAVTDATSKATASVTPGGQLLTSTASPFNYFISPGQPLLQRRLGADLGIGANPARPLDEASDPGLIGRSSQESRPPVRRSAGPQACSSTATASRRGRRTVRPGGRYPLGIVPSS